MAPDVATDQNLLLDDEERFLNGGCMLLAQEIHRLTGWKFCVFYDDDCGLNEHAFVQMPSGHYLDVRGQQTEQEIRSAFHRDEYGEIHALPVWAMNHLVTEWADSTDEEYAGQEARQRAKELAAELVSS